MPSPAQFFDNNGKDEIPAWCSSARNDTARQHQWASGTESAKRCGYRAASPATPGVGGVRNHFLRTGCIKEGASAANSLGACHL